MPHRSLIVGEPWAFCFKAPREGIMRARRKRFELRITDEDRQRLRTLAEQQATTESGAIRALLRQAEMATNEDGAAGKGEAVAA
jgi:hypothetical protein